MSEKDWVEKRAASKNSSILFSNGKLKEETFDEILKDLFSVNIKEDVKLQMVCLIEQQVVLLQEPSNAEHTFCCLMNVFKDSDNSYIVFKSQVLVTMTVICTNFDLKTTYPDIFAKFLLLLYSIKPNRFPFLVVKTSCECLQLIEQCYQGVTIESFDAIYQCAKNETSFLSSSYIILLGTMIEHYKSSIDRHESRLSPDMIKKCLALINDRTSRMSPTGLLQLLKKILPTLAKKKVAQSVFISLMAYCGQSFNILLIWLTLSIQKRLMKMKLYQNSEAFTINHLLLIMPQIPKLHCSLLLNLLQTYLHELPEDRCQHASVIYTPYIQPKIYMKLDTLFQQRVTTFFEFTSFLSSDVCQKNYSEILKIVFFYSKYISKLSEREALFHCLYNLYQVDNLDMQERIMRFIEEYAVYSVEAVANIIDFYENIKQKSYQSSFDLMKRLTEKFLKFDSNYTAAFLYYYLMLLERVALLKEICPLAIIDKLRELGVLFKGCNWDIGNMFLSTCSNILITHSQPPIIYEVASLLWTMHNDFKNNQIKDRALFYYLIIGNVSPTLFSDVFISSTNNGSFEEEKISKEVSTNTPYEISIKRAVSNFLSFSLVECDDQTLQSENTFEMPQDCIDDYKKALSSEEYKRSILHKFMISFKNNQNIQDIFAVEIVFSTAAPYEAVEPVCCPYLSKNHRKGEEITVAFVPKKPQPAIFSVSATYIDTSSNCYSTQLDSIQLKFRHLFTPLPRVPSFQHGVKGLFDALWKDIEKNQHSRLNVTVGNLLSVKYMPNILSWNVKLKLEQFITYEDESVINVGIHLPPRNHVLLKFEFGESCCTKIATDDYNLLDEIDDYLEMLNLLR